MSLFLRYLLIILIPVVDGIFIHAQQPWSLQQCIDTALQNNLTVLQAANATELSRIGLDQSKAYMVPVISGTISQSFGSGRTLNMATYQFTNDNIWGNQFGLNSSVVLFQGFRNTNTICQQEFGLESAEYELQQIKNDIALAVVNAYVQVLFANELLALANSQLEASNTQLQRTESLFAVNLRTESDLLQLRSQVATDRLAIVKAENTLKTTRLALQQWMNTRLSIWEIEPVSVAETELVLSGSPDEIYQEALTTNATVLASEFETESAEYGIKVATGARLPGLMLTGNLGTTYSSGSKINTVSYASSLANIGYLESNPSETVVGLQSSPYYTTSDYPYFDQLDDYFNASVHLSLSIPIVNYQQTHFSVARQEIIYQNALLNEQAGKNKLRQDIELAWADAINARETRSAIFVQLSAVNASWADVQSRYDAGMITAADLLLEKQRHAVVQSDYLRATYQLLLSIKILDYYRGIPIVL